MASYSGRTAPLTVCALALVLPFLDAALVPGALAAPAQGADSSCADRDPQRHDDKAGAQECAAEQVGAPQSTRSLFSAASAAIRARDVAGAVEDYRGIVEASPQDSTALMYLVGWSTFLGNEDDADRYKSKLEEADPARGADLDRMLSAIHNQTSAQITEELPGQESLQGSETAIVTLGAGLHPDGTMPQVLVDRLRKTLDVAHADPSAPIVVTGGKPQNGLTEADAMADWLVAQGVDPSRVHKEDRSASTVQNALFSASILQSLQPSHVVIVTSANHVRRAGALFELAAGPVLPPGFTLTSVASVDPAQAGYDEEADPEDWELRAIYRDSFSVVRPGM
ncbi:MAG: YdcF family protein [Segniliparus sp.]|uniref:YdcF family protein n=1 Tax=Segniliparus sp. TaxID=2804064 RepID=UPI003F3B5F09